MKNRIKVNIDFSIEQSLSNGDRVTVKQLAEKYGFLLPPCAWTAREAYHLIASTVVAWVLLSTAGWADKLNPCSGVVSEKTPFHFPNRGRQLWILKINNLYWRTSSRYLSRGLWKSWRVWANDELHT